MQEEVVRRTALPHGDKVAIVATQAFPSNRVPVSSRTRWGTDGEVVVTGRLHYAAKAVPVFIAPLTTGCRGDIWQGKG